MRLRIIIVMTVISVMLFRVSTSPATISELKTQDSKLASYLSESYAKLEKDVNRMPHTKALRAMNKRLTPFELLEFNMAIEHAKKRYGVQPEVLLAIIKVESGAKPDAVGLEGEIGPMQLMPGTAVYLGVKCPRCIYDNVMGGAKYFAEMYNIYNRVDMAIAAYNSGNKKLGSFIPHRIRPHVNKVMLEYVKISVQTLKI